MGHLKGVDALFDGRHYNREVNFLCVRWYLRFKLSLRDLGPDAKQSTLGLGIGVRRVRVV